MFKQSEADQLVQAATAAMAEGRIEQATTLLDAATRADPHHPMALTKHAEVALHRKESARALAFTGDALAIEPNFAPAWIQRSYACWLAGRKSEALEAARRAVHIMPASPEFRLRLAQFAAWSGLGAETRDLLLPLLAPERCDAAHHAAAISMLGELAIAEGRFEEAGPLLDQALDLQPDLSITRMQRGMNRLRMGQFRAGWADYAAREAMQESYLSNPPALGQPWEGQALTDKTLVVLDDQGHGDAIQFFRYLPLLRARGAAHITWRTFAPLVQLMRDAAPWARVAASVPGDARFDFRCNSTSLPRWFETELDSVPASVPYLWATSHQKFTSQRPSARRSDAGRATGSRPKVGLVWSGDARHTRDHLRSIPAELFLRLADIPGISFHSLQHEVRAADLPALTARPTVAREVETLVDFADTAALIARLDLVITVDTAIAHLAGAMGKPVWILLHVAPDWRWLTTRTESPWYPTARLFRVTPAEWLEPNGSGATGGTDWKPALARVSAALRGFAAG